MRFLLFSITITFCFSPIFCQTQKGNIYLKYNQSLRQNHDPFDGDEILTNTFTDFQFGYFLSNNTLIKVHGNMYDQKASYHYRLDFSTERTNNHRRHSQTGLTLYQYFQFYKSKRPIRPFLGANIFSSFNRDIAKGPFIDSKAKSMHHSLSFDLGLSKRLSGNLFFEFSSTMPLAYYRKSASGFKEMNWINGKPLTFNGAMVVIIGDNLKPNKQNKKLYGKKSKTLKADID